MLCERHDELRRCLVPRSCIFCDDIRTQNKLSIAVESINVLVISISMVVSSGRAAFLIYTQLRSVE